MKLWGLTLIAGLLLGAGGTVPVPGSFDLPTAELDPLFARKGRTYPYTAAMLELGMRMGAATTDAKRGNAEAAKLSLSAFREQYVKVQGLVPSWRSHFPLAPLDELERTAARTRDAKALSEAVDKVEAVCTSCHTRTLFPVQARYRWGYFDDVVVAGEEGADVSFHQVMLDIANGLGALRHHVGRSELDAALKDYEKLRGRFTMMELACYQCHEQPREYFIDARVKGRLFKLGGMLRKGSAPVAEYNDALNELNEMSCFPCHQVHMPAAFLQAHWRRAKP